MRFPDPPSRHTTPRPGRLSSGQELALFVFMCLVLLALIVYGMQA